MNKTSRRLLLVEDELGLVMTLTDLLTSEAYQVETAHDGQKALDMALDGRFDLIILDIMLPGKNGFDVCRDLRQRGVQTPILMLTARGQIVDKVLGFKLGADDYLTKPFDPSELLARIEALLRRAPAADTAKMPETFQFGSVVVDVPRTSVQRNGQPVELSAREFELLCYFIQHRGLTVSREQLLRDVWGYDAAVVTRTVDVHVGLLRQKLEDDPKNPRHFLTVRGFGYKFVDENP